MTQFELTLDKIEQAINSRLKDNIFKIKIDGYNKPGNIILILTIFYKNNNYKLDFIEMKNLRFYKQEENEMDEIEQIKKIINTYDKQLNVYLD